MVTEMKRVEILIWRQETDSVLEKHLSCPGAIIVWCHFECGITLTSAQMPLGIACLTRHTAFIILTHNEVLYNH